MKRRDFLSQVAATAAAGAATADAPVGQATPFRVIDVHLHVFNTKLQGKNGIPDYIRADATVEAALAAMERGGVTRSFLISYAAEDVAVQIRQRGVKPELLRAVASKAYQVEAWKSHKDRFWWFTDHLDPMRPGFLDDLEKDFDMGAAGVKMLPWFHGVLPDHPAYLKVYELCRRRRKPVILDLSWWYFELNPLFNESPARRGLVRSFADYARLLSPLFRQFKDVAFSLAHCGTARTSKDYEDIFPLIAAHANVSCDVAAARDYSADWLQKLVRAVGAHKVMYGTDWPYWATGPDCYRAGSRRWRMITDECPALDDRQKRQILAGNAERFVENRLPKAAEDRARRLHADSVVVVIHDHNPVAADVPLMLAGGVTAKVYQIGVDVEIGKDFLASAAKRDGWKDRARQALDEARRTIAADSGRLRLALTARDIRQAKAEGKVAIMLGVEGGKLLEGSLAALREFYQLGLRELQLRWAVPNPLVEKDELTPFGRAVVRECQKLGIIIDLTHIPEKAFFQTAAITAKPLIVSHGTGHELGGKRVEAVAASRGVIGVHFYSSYLGARPTVVQVLNEIDFLSARAGIDAVALGVDFFPSHGRWREFQNAQGTQDISWAVPDLGCLEEITRGLAARGYKDEHIRAILGGNFLRVCEAVMGA